MDESNQKEVRIRFKDGEKESELTFNGINEHHKLSLIDGFFKFFDLNVDFQEMAETYLKVGHSYKDFYKEVDPSKDEMLGSVTSKKAEDVTLKDIDTEKMQIENNWKIEESSSDPDFRKTGIKIRENGTKYYRCRYICSKCRNKGNHYIKKTDGFITCHECGNRMRVISATEKGFPDTDDYGNFFIAGAYKRMNSKGENSNG